MNKKDIKEYLSTLPNYNKNHDYIIDELVYNHKLIKDSKKKIKDDGLFINVSNNPDKPYFQQNQAVTIYNNCLKNILQLSKKIGLSPLDMKQLEITGNGDDDGFNEKW